jgi:hypothetical protein
MSSSFPAATPLPPERLDDIEKMNLAALAEYVTQLKNVIKEVEIKLPKNDRDGQVLFDVVNRLSLVASALRKRARERADDDADHAHERPLPNE